MSAPRLSLGPNPYYWPRARVAAFYDEAIASPVDIVYLGEVVCGKRHELVLDDWIAIGRRLAAAGKEVVLSGLALPESETDLRVLRRVVGNGEFTIEANDMGAVRLAAEARVPFVIGPHINAYNPAALALLHGCGAVRWVAPIELGRRDFDVLQGAELPRIDVEVFAYGRLPLAFSARCFTARARDHGKDDCGFACIDDPDGMPLATIDGVPLFALNGIQTQSWRPASLAGVLDEVRVLAIDVLRITPQAQHSFDVVRAFRSCLDGSVAPAEAEAALAALTGTSGSIGYWRGTAGMDAPVSRPCA